jgi:hypothetical protein
MTALAPTPAPAGRYSIPAHPSPFVRTPVDLARCPHLSPTAKATHNVLRSYANQHNEAWPGQVRLAQEVGVSPPTLRAALAELVAAGLVTVRRRGQGHTNVYSLTPLPLCGPAAGRKTVAFPNEKPLRSRTKKSCLNPDRGEQDSEECDQPPPAPSLKEQDGGGGAILWRNTVEDGPATTEALPFRHQGEDCAGATMVDEEVAGRIVADPDLLEEVAGLIATDAALLVKALGMDQTSAQRVARAAAQLPYGPGYVSELVSYALSAPGVRNPAGLVRAVVRRGERRPPRPARRPAGLRSTLDPEKYLRGKFAHLFQPTPLPVVGEDLPNPDSAAPPAATAPPAAPAGHNEPQVSEIADLPPAPAVPHPPAPPHAPSPVGLSPPLPLAFQPAAGRELYSSSFARVPAHEEWGAQAPHWLRGQQ